MFNVVVNVLDCRLFTLACALPLFPFDNAKVRKNSVLCKPFIYSVSLIAT